MQIKGKRTYIVSVVTFFVTGIGVFLNELNQQHLVAILIMYLCSKAITEKLAQNDREQRHIAELHHTTEKQVKAIKDVDSTQNARRWYR